MENILVSICCLAFNHEDYIRDAIDSFISQKTDFDYEIIIHDDASTDATTSIIKEYEKKYPNIIRPVYQKDNQFSKSINVLDKFVFPLARGKYVAICEGDDYWIDNMKLQKQYEAMEQRPEIDICSHKSIQVEAETKKVISECCPSSVDTVFPIEKVIMGGGGFVMTNSLFIRNSLFKNELPFRKVYPIDYSIQISGSLRGGMLYLSDCMSAYRVMSKNSWIRNYKNNISIRKQTNLKIEEMLKQLDVDTNRAYHKAIIKTINKNRYINRLRYLKTKFMILLNAILKRK